MTYSHCVSDHSAMRLVSQGHLPGQAIQGGLDGGGGSDGLPC